MEELKLIIDKFKNKIEMIKEILNRIINMMEIYYKINNNIINNYNTNKRNYIKLMNLNNIKDNNDFYICYTCNKNICYTYQSRHEYHAIIIYDDKNYICKKHKKSFI